MCWAGIHAGTARHAIGIGEARVLSRDDAAVEAPAVHVDGEFTLHLIAGPHAALAEDALAEIGHQVGRAGILCAIQMIRARWITTRAKPYPRRYGLQFAIAVGFADEAVQWVIRDHQLDDVLAKALQPRRLGHDVHPRLHWRVTGRDDLLRAIDGL